MAELSTTVTVNLNWLKEKPSAVKCFNCEELIFSDTYRLWIAPEVNNVRQYADKTDIVLCESCYSNLNQK